MPFYMVTYRTLAHPETDQHMIAFAGDMQTATEEVTTALSRAGVRGVRVVGAECERKPRRARKKVLCGDSETFSGGEVTG